MKVALSPEEQLVKKCLQCGIEPEVFFKEKLLELEERKRTLLTVSQEWFSDNHTRYNEYAEHILSRKLDDSEAYGPRSFIESVRKRLSPEARQTPNEDIKRSLLLEAGYKCVYCGVQLTEQSAQVDHILPLAEGGSNDPVNLQPLCQPCNEGKSDYIVSTVEAATRPWFETRNVLVKGQVTLTPSKRFAVLIRDSCTCVMCGRSAKESHLSVEQRISVEHGGQPVYDNLRTVCEKCTKGQTSMKGN